ncbi:hypothetical protein FISHEDRAFT_69860 [Fistulina hepatica ATCC 64428]|uniref:SUN domain-containing protein n=1 Tax=Fistulina hepatica ATCC 64428 TaxID=1128425 RepID=A0A0D7AMA5_9AGAR|nr:hypothetical protein FISHEDRAFT_69860 [Fistulina hepatica ATCC 64428]
MVLFLVLSACLLSFFHISLVSALPPTSPNDPLRTIALSAPRKPEQPVCCLRPLEPAEPVEEELFLSFEEWKTKQLAAQVSTGDAAPNDSQEVDTPGYSPEKPAEELSAVTADIELETESVSPHFRVPLTDRFNYASLDCSARVHTSHRTAKSPSSILSSKRDKYMLSPCNAKGDQFVVVELCEDIRIDTVQLANFEFFSGVFKDFTVSVAKTYTTDPDGWAVAGTYRAKNVRGVQSFHPPRHLRDFYRYIRIDFHSHYSSEYYCPVSLLRVYGLTHLEQWKWDIWEAESRAKSGEAAAHPVTSIEVSKIATATESTVVSSSVSTDEAEVMISNTVAEAIFSDTVVHTPTIRNSESELSSSMPTASTSSFIVGKVEMSSAPAPVVAPSSTTLSSSTSTSSATTPSSTISSPAVFSNMSTTSSAITSASSVSLSAMSTSVNTVSIASAQPSAGAPPPAGTGGESIYRTIMNRLTALEANNTLYVRYFEEHTASMRDVLRRTGEDIGRLEALGKAQSLTFQRSLREWERQRALLEKEYARLSTRVDYLSNEIILEKRLSIAQLCLLVTLLVFMGLTRGSRGMSHAPIRIEKSMRDWGRRQLSMSGRWVVSRFSRSGTPEPSTTPIPVMPADSDEPAVLGGSNGASSSSSKRSRAVRPHRLNLSLTAPRERTPTQRVPLTPRSYRTNLNGAVLPMVAPSVSWAAGIGQSPRTARRSAKSAHLHEVKGPAPSVRASDASSSLSSRISPEDLQKIRDALTKPMSGGRPTAATPVKRPDTTHMRRLPQTVDVIDWKRRERDQVERACQVAADSGSDVWEDTDASVGDDDESSVEADNVTDESPSTTAYMSPAWPPSPRPPLSFMSTEQVSSVDLAVR